MSETVYCIKLQQQAPALPRQPWPGELGKRIVENVSAPAWTEWLKQQTILINEHRLNPMNPEHKAFLAEQMEAYFFADGIDLPEQFKPIDNS